VETIDLKAGGPDEKQKHQPRERMKGRFYMVPEPWFEQAQRCLTSSAQLAIAVRLYRHWFRRKWGTDSVAASNRALVTSTGGGARTTKQKTLLRLAKAGLITIVSCEDKAAPRVRVLDACPTSKAALGTCPTSRATGG
jgi:hypothetical protein